MSLKRNPGFSHLLIFFPSLILVLAVTFFAAREYIYSGFLTSAFELGLNLNSISSDQFVDKIKNQKGDFEIDKRAVFLNKNVRQSDKLAEISNSVLGLNYTSNGEKWIEIDLSDQRLYMKEGETTVGSFLVSTGKYAPTPTGNYRIWIKLRYTRMVGGSKALGTYYNLPNVPYTMYFYQGYGIHGAYWHNDFGRPRSHGCVNMRPEEAAIVFNWANPQLPSGNGVIYPSADNPGTRVVIHD